MGRMQGVRSSEVSALLLVISSHPYMTHGCRMIGGGMNFNLTRMNRLDYSSTRIPEHEAGSRSTGLTKTAGRGRYCSTYVKRAGMSSQGRIPSPASRRPTLRAFHLLPTGELAFNPA